MKILVVIYRQNITTNIKNVFYLFTFPDRMQGCCKLFESSFSLGHTPHFQVQMEGGRWVEKNTALYVSGLSSFSMGKPPSFPIKRGHKELL